MAGIFDNFYGAGGGNGLLPFGDRWADVIAAMQNGQFDPQGGNTSAALLNMPTAALPMASPGPTERVGGLRELASLMPIGGAGFPREGSPDSNYVQSLQSQLPLQQPMPQPAPQAGGQGMGDILGGIGNRLAAGGASFFNAGSPMQALGGLIGGLATGQRQDPMGVAQQNQQQAQVSLYQALKARGVPNADIMGALSNPELAKTLIARAYPETKFEKLEPSQTAGFVTPPGLGAQPGSFTPIQQGGPKFDEISGVRKEITALPEVKRYTEALPVFRSMIESLKNPSAASDLDYVYGIAKIFDPESVVREGEMKLVGQARSIPEQLQGWMQRVVMGEAALPPGVRQKLVEVAHTRMKELERANTTRLEPYKGIAERNKMNTADILPQYPDLPDAPTAAAAAPPPAAIKNGMVIVNPKTGERRVFKDGKWITMKAGQQ